MGYRPQNDAIESPAIGHLLIVAAPAGAGKSTFLDQLKSGTLPAALMAKFPPGVENWIQLESNARSPFLSTLSQNQGRTVIPGVAFHYDTTCKWVWQGHDSREDPLKRLLDLAQTVTIVNLRPSAERLTHQLGQREIKARSMQALRRNRLTWRTGRAIRAAARSTLASVARVFPQRWVEVTKQLPLFSWASKRLLPPTQKDTWFKVAHYEQQDWLDELHARWQAHLRSLVGYESRFEQIDLEPDPNAASEAWYSWVLRRES